MPAIRPLERCARPELDSVWRAGGHAGGGDAAMLHCEQCGCSGELGMGWVTFVRADADEGDDTPWTGEYCPPCAAARFGYRPGRRREIRLRLGAGVEARRRPNPRPTHVAAPLRTWLNAGSSPDQERQRREAGR